jgi:hypothetical protein
MRRSWIIVGFISGLLTSVFYPLLIFLEMPRLLTITLAAFVGPLLCLGSYGLYIFGKLYKNSVSLQIGVVANIFAGVFFTTMLIVQLAIRIILSEMTDNPTTYLYSVHYGLDIVWDIFISIGTCSFGIGLLGHPLVPKFISIVGIIMSITLISLNIYTFPHPPSTELFDIGPFVGLWYTILTIIIIHSFKRVNQLISSNSNEG